MYLDIIRIDFTTLCATCGISDFQVRFSSKITPKEFVSFTLTIFWSSTLIWTLQIVRFCLGLKTINLVFVRFRESLCALNQIDILSIFKFNIIIWEILQIFVWHEYIGIVGEQYQI